MAERISDTAQKMKFSIKYFLSKCDQICIWSHLLKKSLMENFIFCAVWLSWTTENREVSSASSFAIAYTLFDESLIKIKSGCNAPRIEPWGAPGSTPADEEFSPFNTTFCFRF